MPTSSSRTSRGHLRLLPEPDASRRSGRRTWHAVRAAWSLVALFLGTLRSWLSLAVYLAPLAVFRRAPVGRRVRPLATREARVIPFQPPRKAVPR